MRRTHDQQAQQQAAAIAVAAMRAALILAAESEQPPRSFDVPGFAKAVDRVRAGSPPAVEAITLVEAEVGRAVDRLQAAAACRMTDPTLFDTAAGG